MATAAKPMIDYRICVTGTRGEQLVVEKQYQAAPGQWVTSDKYLTNDINVVPTKQKRRPWMELVPALFKSSEVLRCIICGFPLANSVDEGCVPGNCSYRPPHGSTEYARIQEKKVSIERDAVATVPENEFPALAEACGVDSLRLLSNEEALNYVRKETPAETWQRITGQQWPGGRSGAVLALLNIFGITAEPGSAAANMWLQQVLLGGWLGFACPDCKAIKPGVCTNKFHFPNFQLEEGQNAQETGNNSISAVG